MRFARGGVLPPGLRPVTLESCWYPLTPGEVVLPRQPSEALRRELQEAGYVVLDVADLDEDDA